MVEQTTESTHPSVPVAEISAGLPSTWHRIWDSDVFYSFRASKVTMVAAFVTFMIFFLATFAPLVAPHSPFDVATIDLMDAELPPAWEAEGDQRFLLGTDNLGRDLWSTILYGTRISLVVGFFAVFLTGSFGLLVGLVSGYFGGKVDFFLMRLVDLVLSFPFILS